LTKYFDSKHFSQPNHNDIATIGEDQIREVEGKEKEFICDMCRCSNTLVRLIDSSGENNNYYFCSRCKTSVYDTDNLRTEDHLEMSDGPIEEVAVSHTPERTLKRKKNEPKGTFRKMQERGMHITNYQERGWRKEKEEYT
jgi:hypothetical protein